VAWNGAHGVCKYVVLGALHVPYAKRSSSNSPVRSAARIHPRFLGHMKRVLFVSTSLSLIVRNLSFLGYQYLYFLLDGEDSSALLP